MRPLADLSHAELEELYAGPLGHAPVGVHDGSFSASSPGAAPTAAIRVAHTLLFRWPRWGVDLDTLRWWFFDRRCLIAPFTIERGPSRWRDAEVLQLRYDASRLPRAVRRILYDELKPLPDGRVLGLGGAAGERGVGDHFWFALTPRAG